MANKSFTHFKGYYAIPDGVTIIDDPRANPLDVAKDIRARVADLNELMVQAAGNDIMTILEIDNRGIPQIKVIVAARL